MGRELKRVPLDFNWELGITWIGYENPFHMSDCEKCYGRGYSKEYNELLDKWYGTSDDCYMVPNPFQENLVYNVNAWRYNLTKEDVQVLLDADRLWDFTRVPINEKQKLIVELKLASGDNSWLPFDNGHTPTPMEVNEWELSNFFGHDGTNRSLIIKNRLKKLGLSDSCNICNGLGVIWLSEKDKQNYETWKPYNPPTGEGYQVWATTSLGRPITPVFANIDSLCEYCQDNDVSVFGSTRATKEGWKKILTIDGFSWDISSNKIVE